MSNIDETELARLETLAGKSSDGPWRVDNDARTLWVGDGDERCEDIARASALLHVVDLHYIAAACNAVPALVAEVRRLREEIKQNGVDYCALMDRHDAQFVRAEKLKQELNMVFNIKEIIPTLEDVFIRTTEQE